MSHVLDATALAAVEQLIDDTLIAALDQVEAVAAVERGDIDQPFWYVRIDGETKQHFSAEFTLGQRTLVVESYFMPEPDENREKLLAQLLKLNRGMHGLGFVIGAENAIYLRGQLENRFVDRESVDRLLAAVYEYTEKHFLMAMRLAFGSRFTR